MTERITPVRRAPKRSGTRPFRYDQHGDLVDLDDDCGANVSADPLYARLLAQAPLRYR